MRQLPNIVRLLICSLLIGGYGAMYAGSVMHDLGHSVQSSEHAEKHHDHNQGISDSASEKHLEVNCFFCTHAPVVSSEITAEQIWTPAIASLAPPTESAEVVHTTSIPLPELRGPPAV
jgi:hypothetical protein